MAGRHRADPLFKDGLRPRPVSHRRTEAGVDTDVAGLLARVGSGDQAAFAAFYRCTVTQVFSLVSVMLDDAEAAEDVTAGVYRQLSRTAAGYDPGRGSAQAWLLDLAHRHAVGHLRAHRVAAASPAGTATSELTPLPPSWRPAFLERLDALSRELILLIYCRGYTTAQAASLLGLPAAAAGPRLRAALRALSQTRPSGPGTSSAHTVTGR
jgi:RNA polymerase sigma-70 factor, ECF subfamily